MAYRFSQLSGRLVASNPLAAYRPQGIKAFPEISITSAKPSSSVSKTPDLKEGYKPQPEMKGVWDHMTSNEIVHHMTPRQNLSAYGAMRQRIHENRVKNINQNVQYDAEGKVVWWSTARDKMALRTLIFLIGALTIFNMGFVQQVRFGRKK